MACGCNAPAGLGASLNTYNGPVPPGVPNPYTVMLHSYPTRYHGPIYTRPMYNLDWSERPNDFALDESMMGLGDGAEASVLTVQPMTPWRTAVGIGLAAVVVWGALSIADRSHA
jgi:hypothetical protein